MGGLNAPWFDSGWIELTGASGAYAALDACGGKLTIPGMPLMGLVVVAQVLDLSDVGATNGAMIIHLFNSSAFTATADNAPLAISDADVIAYWETSVTVDSGSDNNVNFLLEEGGLNQMFSAPSKTLYAQCQVATGAAPTLATAPRIRLRGLILEP
jgi:hypothetical protein